MTNSFDCNSLLDNSSSLSDRELQVIELVAAGLTNQDIAAELAISKRTVDNHVSNILKKTRTDNRVALVLWALQWGKVCIDEVNCCNLEKSQVSPSHLKTDLKKELQHEIKTDNLIANPLDTELCA